MNTLISIIVPVYKSELYMVRCLDSIVHQTYRNLEIILVDDGSPDKCGEICDEYASRDGRIKVIHQENRGVSAARNAGLDIASGEYVGFVDSDDYIDLTMFEELLNAIKSTSADMAICDFTRILKTTSEPNDKPLDSSMTTEKIKELIITDDYPSYFWNKLFAYPVLKNKRFPVGRVFEDYALLPVLLSEIQKICVIENRAYFYNCANTNSITNVFTISLEKEYSFFLMHLERIQIARNSSEEAYKRCIKKGFDIVKSLLRRNAQENSFNDEQIKTITQFIDEYASYNKKKISLFLFKHCRPVFNIYNRYRFQKIKKRKEKNLCGIQ